MVQGVETMTTPIIATKAEQKVIRDLNKRVKKGEIVDWSILDKQIKDGKQRWKQWKFKH